MGLETVARMMKEAATDTNVLSALQNDPVRMRDPLQLSEAHLRALISAGSFSSAQQAKTINEPNEAFATEGDVVGLGSLLPPEGTGSFPGLPLLTPGLYVPSPSGQPRASPTAPRPTPRSPTRSVPTVISAPQGPIPIAPPTYSTPQPSVGPSYGKPQTQPSTPTAMYGESCCCSCTVAIVAIVAQVSTTAQTAITAITAISELP